MPEARTDELVEWLEKFSKDWKKEAGKVSKGDALDLRGIADGARAITLRCCAEQLDVLVEHYQR
jgi:hypothetical protein